MSDVEVRETRRHVKCSARIDVVLEGAPPISDQYWLLSADWAKIESQYATLDCEGDGSGNWTGSVSVGGQLVPDQLWDERLLMHGRAIFSSEVFDEWPAWVKRLFEEWKPQ